MCCKKRGNAAGWNQAATARCSRRGRSSWFGGNKRDETKSINSSTTQVASQIPESKAEFVPAFTTTVTEAPPPYEKADLAK